MVLQFISISFEFFTNLKRSSGTTTKSMPQEDDTPLKEGDMVQVILASTVCVGMVIEVQEGTNQVTVLGSSWRATVDAAELKKVEESEERAG